MKEDEALKSVLQKLGSKYEYIKYIGQGSFSKVYLLKHKMLGEKRALKIMDSQYILQTLEKGDSRDVSQKFASIKTRFIREAQAFSKIYHLNIVRFYDVDVLEDISKGIDIIYIIMQFAAGKSLKSIIAEDSLLEMDRIFAISRDILHAVARIHEAGIIHRDIKPANIIIEQESGRAILIDFGLAKDINDLSENTAIREADRSLGTPIYMSPDQFQVQGKIGPETDLYAFGILLFEMLAGEAPFKGTLAEIIKGHLQDPVPDIRDKNPLAPARLQEIIEKALAKEPEMRYQKAEEILEDLERIEHNMTAGKQVDPKRKRDYLAAAETAATVRKRKKYLIYTALAVLAVSVMIYIFILSPKNSNDLGYNKYFKDAQKAYERSDHDKAEYLINNALKIKNTIEAQNFAKRNKLAKLQSDMKKEYAELDSLLKGNADLDTKLEACRSFLDKYKNITINNDTRAMISHIEQSLEGNKPYEEHIAKAVEYLKSEKYREAYNSLKMAKASGNTQKTAELENEIYEGCIAAAQAFCNEAKPVEAEENYSLAKQIKPVANLQAMDRTIKFLKSLPEDVRAVYKKNKNIKQNFLKYWEADFGSGIVLVYIPTGGGLPGFWMGKTEVSVGQYMKFVYETGSNVPEWLEPDNDLNIETGTDNHYRNQTGDNYPIVGISWENAVAYCRWLSGKTGLTFKLPSEAEWLKAAQGTDSRPYPWGGGSPGNNLANFFSLSRKTVRVDSFPQGASPFGLLNMAGNVEEWCINGAARGGSFYSNERYIQCTARQQYDRNERNHALGFRLCMTSK